MVSAASLSLPIGILGQAWYLIVSIPDLCTLTYFEQKGREIYKTWTGISGADAKKLDTYYACFKNHVQPTLNPIFARCLFNNEKQGAENIDAFVTRLKTKALDCNFAERDNMFRDRIVTGCTSV